MDLLLSHGYFLGADPAEQRIMRPYPPLGLLYLSAYLKRSGIDAVVYDATFGSEEEFFSLLVRRRPRIVGLYANLMTRGTVLRLQRQARLAGAIVVLGGPEPASYSAEYLARGAHVVVDGEGEMTAVELVTHLLGRGLVDLDAIPGIHFLDARGNVVKTTPRAQIKDLDALPFPDRHAIDVEAYLDAWRSRHGEGSVSLITARGCPYECQWCSHGVYGFTHRRRSPENVAEEVALIASTWQPELLWYADDVFTIHHRWLRDYASALERRRLHIPFETISREDRLDEETVRILAGMGCRRLWIGAESGSQRVLDAMKRGTNAERMREMVRLLQEYDIEAGTFIMLGYDGEEQSDIEATVAHLKAALPDHVLTTLAYPIKGTAYYEAVQDRLVPYSSWEEGSDRDLGVSGRHSRRYYRHAQRWIDAEIARARLSRQTGARLAARLRAQLHSRLGRLGMRLFRHEREGLAG
jgi:radical SAM superfamily enzyme YgiQ (UPF0313 family)